MRLNHLDLQVSNVTAARAFFETHFGLTCVYQRGEDIAFFGDDSGFEFSVSNLAGRSERPEYPPEFHVGFILAAAEDVLALHDGLAGAGVPIRSGPREAGPNLFFVCEGPDGVPVEVRAPRRVK
ncbi:VOC family protein [Deinococcus pimensis]|uniref:VOC family protein n=1 Tax=Deinococcus pimensis TaxID=309888 RepID=UPI0004825249|nr:VOC family protein [Deinococcus pimensis]